MKKLIAILISLMTIFTLMIPVFSSAEAATDTNAVMWVNCADGKRLNVRAEANKNSKLIVRLDCGSRVEIDSDVPAPKGWAFVTAKDHKDGGFVMTRFLVSQKPGKYEITERDDNFRALKTPYVVTAKVLNSKTDKSVGLRVSPNKTAKMIRRLSAGDELKVIEIGKVWSKVIDLTTGKTGYVANDYMVR